MVTTLLAAASLASATLQALPAANGRRELTPADAVATVRVMENQLPGSQHAAGNTSPDGRRYLLRLASGDVNRNGVWVDLLAGSLDSLESASHPRLCAHLFTSGLGSTQSARAADADPSPTNQITWMNNSRIAFLWSDPQGVRQVISVDLRTCKRHWLTHSATNVYSFASTGGSTLLFNAQVPETRGRSAQLWHDGFTLDESADGWSILQGRVDGTSYLATWLNAWFIQSGPTLRSVTINGKSVDTSNPNFREVSIGPSGRYAIAGVGAASIPQDWQRYSNAALQRTLQVSQTDQVLTPVRFAVIDLHTGDSRMLWNAPNNSHSRAQWSPLADRILLAPAFLPPDALNSPVGLTGAAAVDVDVKTGNYRVLPLDLTDRTVVSTNWHGLNAVEILSSGELAADTRTDCFVLIDDAWQAVPPLYLPVSKTNAAPIHVQIRQSLNAPPQIFAVDSLSGEERLILDTNPHLLGSFKLGQVERISGALANGGKWLGQLIYPADYVPGRKYPLVIQGVYARAFGSEEFSLQGSWGMSGMGLGPSDMAAYPGQLLATRNIAVLQLEVLHPSPGVQEATDYQLAFETAAELLSSSGLVERDKIALDGFSRNGFWVEFTLTHSSFPFAAAIAADNYDPSYFQSALSNWRALDVAPNGAPAFGAGLLEWLKHAPGFNAERIHTPLRMIGQSDGMPLIMAEWEIYSRLRFLKKPVEFYMMPESNTHPSHIPQNPRQIMAIQEGVIDWFSFWLTGREDPSRSKRAQYIRWHSLAASQAAASLQAASAAIADPQL